MSESFTAGGYFMCHVMVQSGEKCCVCSVCGKAFTGQISLKRKLRLHTGEKLSSVVVVGFSLWNVIWKDTLKDCTMWNSNFTFSHLLTCDPLTQQHIPTEAKPHPSNTACCSTGLKLFYFPYFCIYFLCECVIQKNLFPQNVYHNWCTAIYLKIIYSKIKKLYVKYWNIKILG